MIPLLGSASRAGDRSAWTSIAALAVGQGDGMSVNEAGLSCYPGDRKKAVPVSGEEAGGVP